jgi:hypothetical protein
MRHGFVRVKFAGPLKTMLRSIGLTKEQIEGDLKEAPTPLLCGKTPRHAMQTLGTEWGRNLIGEHFWIRLWSETVADVLNPIIGAGGRVVVDDCRFENEAGAARRLGGLVVRLAGRSGVIGASHSSELMNWVADLEIANDNTITALYGNLDELVA